MRKIPTLFLRDPDDMRRVTSEVHPDCQWVLDGEGRATRKYDGTCVMLDDAGMWWARREVKRGKTPPADFVEADYDEATGKRQGWIPIVASDWRGPWTEAMALHPNEPGTYELCGPKINGNPEGFTFHRLIRHGVTVVPQILPPVELVREYCKDTGAEGIVWHHPDGRMAKLKARDLDPDPIPTRPEHEESDHA
jgi:hypothetical protein